MQVNGNQVINSTDKTTEIPFNFTVNTNNRTGYTATLSSETENTALTNTSSAVGAKIDSISTNLTLNNLPNNTWGYKFGASSNYVPIPALSTPAQILQTAGKTNGNESNQLSIGMKLADNLESGNYTNKLILSFVSNPYIMRAIMTNGPDFNTRVGALDTNTGFASWDSSVAMMTNIRYVKKSVTRPSVSQAAINIEDPDSDYEILAWFDMASGTVYYYSDAEKIELSKDSSFMFHNFSGLQEIDMRNFDGKNIENLRDLFSNCSSLTSVNFAGFNTSKVNNMTSMFYANFALKNLDLSSFDTSNVIYMNDMFAGMSELTSLNLSSFNTSKVEVMVNMFHNMQKIKSLNVSNFDTRNVVKMRNMFSNMLALESLDISNFNTSKVEDMAYMFSQDHKIKTLNFGNLNTSRVTTMEYMFQNMWALESLDVSSFDTSNVTNMRDMFGGVAKITTLNLNNFNTSKVTNMRGMFNSMLAIENLSLPSFDTRSVTTMNGMFGGMEGLKNLNISSFDTSSVQDFRYMFGLGTVPVYDHNLVDHLEHIYTSKKFVISAMETGGSEGIFYRRPSLTVGAGCTYVSGTGNPFCIGSTWVVVP
ncbi:MAG: BspA family leucine-rich repeat surface protein [Candidatus Nanosynbacter sp.]|nr:BspA family leucine-rich repeat surface protein [Candidatus Nanosynbacter sp.]